MTRQPRCRAFTLIEILVVVVILGILAAIVFAQVSGATDSAKSSSIKSQLQTVRGQLELYYTQHAGSYPTLAQLNANWTVMTGKTDIAGNVSTSGAYGPYLQQPPRNPIQDSASLAAAPAAGVGWVYDETTGDIRACVPASKATALGLATGDVSTY